MAPVPVVFSGLCCIEPRNGFSPSGDERLDFDRTVQILQSMTGTLAAINKRRLDSTHVVKLAIE